MRRPMPTAKTIKYEVNKPIKSSLEQRDDFYGKNIPPGNPEGNGDHHETRVSGR